MYHEEVYRIEVINLSGEIVCLSVGSLHQFSEEALPDNLPDEIYFIRISGEDGYLHERLLLNKDN